MHRFKHVTHPHNVLLVVRRLGPAPDDFEEEGRGPASTGVSSSPTRAIAPPSAQTESETRGSRRAAVPDCFDDVVGEPIEVNRLPIVEELALPKERIEELLERVIGDRRGHIEDWLVELLSGRNIS